MFCYKSGLLKMCILFLCHSYFAKSLPVTGKLLAYQYWLKHSGRLGKNSTTSSDSTSIGQTTNIARSLENAHYDQTLPSTSSRRFSKSRPLLHRNVGLHDMKNADSLTDKGSSYRKTLRHKISNFENSQDDDTHVNNQDDEARHLRRFPNREVAKYSGSSGKANAENGEGDDDYENYYEEIDNKNTEPYGRKRKFIERIPRLFHGRPLSAKGHSRSKYFKETEEGKGDEALTEMGRRKKQAGRHRTAEPKIWENWGKWSRCTVTRGEGKIARWRHCIGGGCALGEKEAQIKTCSASLC